MQEQIAEILLAYRANKEKKSVPSYRGSRVLNAVVVSPLPLNKEALISILQKVQERLGYLPKEAFPQIASSLRISESDIFGVATFYAQFRFNPPGEHNIKVCFGTACHVRGGARILDAVERELGITPGETTPDRKFDLERVACFGCCALAPVVVVDNKVYGQMTSNKAKRLLETHRNL